MSYTYRGDGLPTRITHSALGAASLAWDSAGRLTDVTTPDHHDHWDHDGGLVCGYVHDGHVTRVARDAQGRVTGIEGPSGRWSYGYNEAGSLISATGPRAQHTWTHDAYGRLTSHATSGTDTTFTWDQEGHLTQTCTRAHGHATATQYGYDAAGRRISATSPDGQEERYSWDRRGCLSGITTDATTVSTHVDALGCASRITTKGQQVLVDWDLVTGAPTSIDGHPVLPLPGGRILGATPIGDTNLWREVMPTDPDNPYEPATVTIEGIPETIRMAGNALVVDGHPWWGARLYDPTTATFLSPDPLTPPTGALWANNPYDYANNNPLTLTHPIGTLAHYVANSVSTLVHHITDPISHWWAIHKDRILSPEFIGGALAIGLGIAVSATGVGGPIGAAIISGALFGAGSTTAIEKCATGHVNWRDVAMSGLVGGFTNGLGSWVSKTALLTKNAGQTVAGLRAMAGVNAFTGSIGSTISYTFSSGPKSLRGYAGALISGGAAGGLDGMAGPTAGSISRNLSKESSPFTEKVIEHTIGFGASTSGSVINSLVSGEHVSLADIGKTSVVDQAVSSAGSRLFPGQHGVESIESSSFGVRSLHGIIKPTGKTHGVFGLDQQAERPLG